MHLLVDLLYRRGDLAVELLHQPVQMLKSLGCRLLARVDAPAWTVITVVLEVWVVSGVLIERGVLDLELLRRERVCVLLRRSAAGGSRTRAVQGRSRWGLTVHLLAPDADSVRWQGARGEGAGPLLREDGGGPALALVQVVARSWPVLSRLENAARLPEARAVPLELLFLGDEVLTLNLHLVRRALGVPHALVELGRDQVLVPPQCPWRVCAALVLVAVNLLVPLDPLLVKVLPLLDVLEDVLVVVLLRGLLVLRVHRIESRHDARERSLAADAARLRPLSPDEEVVADQVVLVVDDDRLVLVPVLQAHHRASLRLCLEVLPATFSFWHVLVLLDGALRADPLGRVRLLEDALVLLGLFGCVAARTLALLAGNYLWLSLRPNLHDATLRPASDGHALAVVRPIFLGEYVLEHRELVVIHIEEIILLIVVVVKVDDSEVVRGALVVPLLPRVVVVGVCW